MLSNILMENGTVPDFSLFFIISMTFSTPQINFFDDCNFKTTLFFFPFQFVRFSE